MGLVKFISKDLRFTPIHLLLLSVVTIATTILLSVYFYSRSIDSFIGNIKQTASVTICDNYLVDAVSIGGDSIDYEVIKGFLKQEYPIVGDRLDAVDMSAFKVNSKGEVSVQEMVRQVIDYYFDFITRKLTIIKYSTLLSALLLQILFIVIMLMRPSNGNRNRSNYSRQRNSAYRRRRYE